MGEQLQVGVISALLTACGFTLLQVGLQSEKHFANLEFQLDVFTCLLSIVINLNAVFISMFNYTHLGRLPLDRKFKERLLKYENLLRVPQYATYLGLAALFVSLVV